MPHLAQARPWLRAGQTEATLLLEYRVPAPVSEAFPAPSSPSPVPALRVSTCPRTPSLEQDEQGQRGDSG